MRFRICSRFTPRISSPFPQLCLSVREYVPALLSSFRSVNKNFRLRFAGISRNVEGLLEQAVHVLQGDEEHTQVVRQIDQFTDRVEVDVVFSSVCSEGDLVEDRCCQDHWVSSNFLVLSEPDRRKTQCPGMKLPAPSLVVSGVLEVWFVASMRFVRNRKLVHHQLRSETPMCPFKDTTRHESPRQTSTSDKTKHWAENQRGQATESSAKQPLLVAHDSSQLSREMQSTGRDLSA